LFCTNGFVLDTVDRERSCLFKMMKHGVYGCLLIAPFPRRDVLL
jgi:hypothetical protein